MDTRTRSPITLRSTGAASLTMPFTSTAAGISVCWRPNASSWRVSIAASRAAAEIPPAASRRTPFSGNPWLQLLDVRLDDRQEIVEFVRDSAGESGDRLQVWRIGENNGALRRPMQTGAVAAASPRNRKSHRAGDLLHGGRRAKDVVGALVDQRERALLVDVLEHDHRQVRARGDHRREGQLSAAAIAARSRLRSTP